MEKLNQKINECINLINKTSNDLNDIVSKFKEIQSEIKKLPKNPSSEPNILDELKPLLVDWPEAVDPELICDENNEKDQMERAEAIFYTLIDKPLKDKKVLDFGCGQGYFSKFASTHNPKISIGYDIETEEYEQDYVLTTNWDKIIENGPYDIILIYDVLDHAINGNPIELLIKIREVCDKNTTLHVRCHPWCSIHGTHLYKNNFNKAYAHLIFSDEMLEKLKVKPGLPTVKVIHPQKEYDQWFDLANYKKINSNLEEIPNNKFFEENAIIKSLIQKNWGKSHIKLISSGKQFPQHQLRQEFLDYTLQIKN